MEEFDPLAEPNLIEFQSPLPMVAKKQQLQKQQEMQADTPSHQPLPSQQQSSTQTPLRPPASTNNNTNNHNNNSQQSNNSLNLLDSITNDFATPQSVPKYSDREVQAMRARWTDEKEREVAVLSGEVERLSGELGQSERARGEMKTVVADYERMMGQLMGIYL